jgi:tetratricopeptide (TPR) repeat protein
MSDTPPPSLLITPDTRRRLQQQYEEAVRLMAQRPCDYARVHDLLAECLRTDPGNILYLDELLANLRRWGPKPKRSWIASWFGGGVESLAKDSRTPHELLRDAPELLRDRYRDATALGELAEAAGECQLDSAELVYRWDAVNASPDDTSALRGLARCLTRSGRFEEALDNWLKIATVAPDGESARAVSDLQLGPDGADQATAAVSTIADPADIPRAIEDSSNLQRGGSFAEADKLLRQALSAAGGDLRVHEALEALQLSRSAHRVEIAKRRARSDDHPRAKSLVGRMEQEHNRLEIDILHVRSERHPDDLSLRLELARRLKKSGNYSGAIGRLEEARDDARLTADVLLELGECWQQLRQFGRALDFYRQALVAAEREGEAPAGAQVGILYRIGVLAAAMNQPEEAKAALTRLVAIDPDYKDARQRLDNLP